MKNRLTLTLATTLVVAGVTSLQAQLSYTFSGDAEGFQNFTWSAAGPAGWSGGSALQVLPGAGGWTLGGSFNFLKEFDWMAGGGAPNQQVAMQTLSAGGVGRISFDVIVDGSSFTPGVAGWYNINIAGNSAGAGGWTQIDSITGAAWHNADDNTLYSTHVDYSFAQLGWQDPEDATGWFQLYFGANSDGTFPINFYIDNVEAYAVPEPSTIGLLGLGLAGVAILRRRLS